jgi:hypothetical protein
MASCCGHGGLTFGGFAGLLLCHSYHLHDAKQATL